MDNGSFKIDNSLRGILARGLLWSIICSVTAIPSFIWARSEYSLLGMVAGVGLFAAMYTFVSGTPTVGRWRTSRLANRTLRIGYFSRVVVSAIVPLGMALDLIPGLLSVTIVESAASGTAYAGRGTRGFIGTLAITLVQGTFLHVILGVYMLVVHLIQWWWVGKEYPEGHCRKCGYDLRASYEFGRCPECGTPFRCRKCGYDLRASYEFGRCPECGTPCGSGAEGSPDVSTAAVSETFPGETRKDVGDDPETPAR